MKIKIKTKKTSKKRSNLTDEEEAEFAKELKNDGKSSTRKFEPFDWFLVTVIVVLTFILIKMLLNR